jgi:hypothetical protein
MRVHLPAPDEDAGAMAEWTPGFLTAEAVTETASVPGRALASNQVAWALAPRITVTPRQTQPGDVDLTVTCAPRIRQQHVVLLVNRRSQEGDPEERQIEPASITNPGDVTQPTSLQFSLPNLGVGTYQIRLRVDGVDSIPVVWDADTQRPAFDVAQTVEVTA